MALVLSHQRTVVPLRETFRTAIRSTDVVDAIRIEISASNDAAHIGIGYATATPLITGDTLDSIEAHLDGPVAELLSSESIGSSQSWEKIGQRLAELAPRSPSGTAGVDLALYDLRMRQGGGATGSIAVATSVTISAGSADEMAASSISRLNAGFRIMKCKLGVDPSGDAARIRVVWRALMEHEPNARLWVDANQGWTVKETLQFVDSAFAAGVEIERLEQPIAAADFDGLAEVCRRIPMPLVADESAKTLADIDRIADSGAAEFINVKFMKSGGRLGAMRAVDRARRHNLGVLVGSMMEHPQSVAAAVRFATVLSEPVHDLDAGWWARDTRPLIYERGTVRVTTDVTALSLDAPPLNVRPLNVRPLDEAPAGGRQG